MKELFIPTQRNNYTPYLLRKFFLVSYTVILVLVNTFGGLLGISRISASNITPQNIVSLTNQERSIAGLNTLSNNQKLAAAAQAKAENMFEEQYWDHFGPNGETPWQFITGAGYNYVYAGENLAKGFRTSEGVVEAWMASKTHRDNILSKNYKDIGIAVMTGVLLGKETTLVVQMFGNLTTDVYSGPTTQAPQEKETKTPVTRTPVIERGQISAISITYPRQGDILKDSSVRIEGSIQGSKQDYVVEIFDFDEKLLEAESKELEWEYSSDEEWDDGEHEIKARVKGTSIQSEKVEFIIDTSPPSILKESIRVVRVDSTFTISFDTEHQWHELRIINGDDEISFLGVETINNDINLEGFEPTGRVILQISDEAGNTSEVDITEYFLEGVTDEYNTFSFGFLKRGLQTTDGINFVIISFILLLILLQVYILWKKEKLNKSIGDIFVLGLWITILTIGIFKGFGGISL